MTKLDSTGSALDYSTFLGGNIWDFGAAIAVDADDNAYVTGWTTSSDFPTTDGAFERRPAGCPDVPSRRPCSAGAFVAKLKMPKPGQGIDDLLYSTYLGGSASDYASSIAVDAQGNAYVTGSTTSHDFPTKEEAFDRALTVVLTPLWRNSKCQRLAKEWTTSSIPLI